MGCKQIQIHQFPITSETISTMVFRLLPKAFQLQILIYIHNLSIVLSRFSIHHNFKNSNSTLFIVDEISLTSFSSRVSS